VSCKIISLFIYSDYFDLSLHGTIYLKKMTNNIYSFLSFFFNSLFSISSCCSVVACIISNSLTLGIFRSTGNDRINSRASLEICGFSSSILLLPSSRSSRSFFAAITSCQILFFTFSYYNHVFA
jgi:hypothetical protein